MADVQISDLDKDGNFVDKNGVKQKAVSLDAIFGMVGGGNRTTPQTLSSNIPQNTPKQFKGKKKPTTKRGIKF